MKTTRTDEIGKMISKGVNAPPLTRKMAGEIYQQVRRLTLDDGPSFFTRRKYRNRSK